METTGSGLLDKEVMVFTPDLKIAFFQGVLLAARLGAQQSRSALYGTFESGSFTTPVNG